MEENPEDKDIDGMGNKELREECRKRGFTAPPYHINVGSKDGGTVPLVIYKDRIDDPHATVLHHEHTEGLPSLKPITQGLDKTKRMEDEQLRTMLKLILRDPRFAHGQPIVQPAFYDRSCQNCYCIVIFVLYWAIMLVVAGVGLVTGDPLRLVRPTDYQGNACEDVNFDSTRDKPNLVYPRIAEDAMSMMQDQDGSCAGSEGGCFYGICVKECPEPGDIVCNYEAQAEVALLPDDERRTRMEQRARYRQGCWFNGMQLTNLLFRCFPFEPGTETSR